MLSRSIYVFTTGSILSFSWLCNIPLYMAYYIGTKLMDLAPRGVMVNLTPGAREGKEKEINEETT